MEALPGGTCVIMQPLRLEVCDMGRDSWTWQALNLALTDAIQEGAVKLAIAPEHDRDGKPFIFAWSPTFEVKIC